MPLATRLSAEAVGTAFLVAAVVGSGIMAARLTDDIALVLLCNALATGAMLVVLVTVPAPLSGAHLNPAITAALALQGQIAPREAGLYMLVQVAGGIAGVLVAHLMFDAPLLQSAITERTGTALWLSEAVAAFGLVAIVLTSPRFDARSLPWLIGLYIIAAYWFTASTSFANPAVTLARGLTDSFSGIQPADILAFILAQMAGACLAVVLTRSLPAPLTKVAD